MGTDATRRSPHREGVDPGRLRTVQGGPCTGGHRRPTRRPHGGSGPAHNGGPAGRTRAVHPQVRAPSVHGDWAPRPDRPSAMTLLAAARGDACPRAGAAAPRAHGRIAVRVLPRRGERVGRPTWRISRATGLKVQLCGDAHLAELRWVRITRTVVGLRHQRLRRDVARAVRVGREASGRELRRRRLVQRARRRAAREGRRHVRRVVLQGRWRSSPGWATSSCGTRASPPRTS